ncbi:MAG: helix-turn-helix domain-containing protein [Beijerinckiaceae bacterium]|nr:helix-turn-helix domain-containing protein [Beijerinckiaceae bacterium]
MQVDVFPIGDLSRQTGCHIETIRYYERIGLLPKPSRRGRYRTYTPADVARLRFVCRSRELGFAIKEVKALLRLEIGGVTSCAEAKSMAAKHLQDVRSRIADLRRMEHVLASTVKACDDGDSAVCPLIAALTQRVDGGA